MNTLLLKPTNDGEEPFKARVTEAGKWLDVSKAQAHQLETLAWVYADDIGYRLPHIHKAGSRPPGSVA